jgi:Flp pilus assembly protein TadD
LAFADEMLDAGIKIQSAEPTRLSIFSRDILLLIATSAKKPDKRIALQRLFVKQLPADPRAFRELALDLAQAGKHEEAVATLEELITKFPEQKKDIAVVNTLTQCRLLAGQNQGALESAREAVKLDSNDFIAQYWLGSALGRVGKNQEAIDHFKTMLEKFANNEEAVKRTRSGLSVIYVNLDRFAEGEKELEILLEKEPDDPGINNDLGYLYADQGKNLEKAESMIRKAVEEEPDNSAYLDSLGWVLYKRGRVKEAVEPLEKAAASKESNSDPTMHDHLGDIYYSLKQADKAKSCWERAEKIAAKSSPPDKKLSEIRKKLKALGQLTPKSPAGDNP